MAKRRFSFCEPFEQHTVVERAAVSEAVVPRRSAGLRRQRIGYCDRRGRVSDPRRNVQRLFLLSGRGCQNLKVTATVWAFQRYQSPA